MERRVAAVEFVAFLFGYLAKEGMFPQRSVALVVSTETALRQARVQVAERHRRHLGQCAPHLFRSDPIRKQELHRFAEAYLEAALSDAAEVFDATVCAFDVLGSKLQGDRSNGSRQAGNDLVLESLDIDLDEGRATVLGDQIVERIDLHRFRSIPLVIFEAPALLNAPNPLGRQGGNRVRVADQHLSLPRRRAERLSHQVEVSGVPEGHSQKVRALTLWLDGDNRGAELAEYLGAIPQIGPDVEDNVARSHKLAVEIETFLVLIGPFPETAHLAASL